MNRIIETLESYGLVSVDLALSVFDRMSRSKIVSLSEELAGSIEEDDSRFVSGTPTYADPFSFLASASLRGDAGCSAIECRTRALSLLARYSALYCDHVAVPFVPHIDPELDVVQAREALLQRLVTIIELRPVIEAGIARLFIPTRCNHCMQKLPLGVGVARLAQRLASEQFKKFSATYLPWEYGFDVRIEGPNQYIDHGALVQPHDEVPEWLPKKIRKLRDHAVGVKLSTRTLRKSRLVNEVFETIAVDVIHQRLEAEHRPLNYLMGRRGEAEFLMRLNSDHDIEQRTAALCAQLAHTVPTLMDIPLPTVLAIRRKEPESFVDYRNTIRNIVANHLRSGGTVSEKDAQQIYLDILRPRLDKLKKETHIQRRRNLRNSMVSFGVPAALLSIGVLGGVLPPEISSLLKISGTLGLVNEGVKAILGSATTPPSSRNDGLYFLLELEANSDS